MNILNTVNRYAESICSRLPSPVIKTKNGSLVENTKHTTQPFVMALICQLASNYFYSSINSTNNNHYYSVIINGKLESPIDYFQIAQLTFTTAFAVYGVIQKLRVYNAIDESLIQEFITKPFPSNESFNKISRSKWMLQEVIKRNKDALNKRSPEGKSLLQAQASYDGDLEIIKFLLDNAAWSSKEIYELIDYQMRFNNNIFESICTPSLIKLLKPIDQHELLKMATSTEAFDALKAAGININAVNEDGHSPLFAICSRQHICTRLSRAFLANALIEAGADINEKFRLKTFLDFVKYEEEDLNVLQAAEKFSMDKDLIAVLKNHMSYQEKLARHPRVQIKHPSVQENHLEKV